MDIPTDVVEMEAFAIAKVCKNEEVEFHCYKYISDTAKDQAKQIAEQTKRIAELHKGKKK